MKSTSNITRFVQSACMALVFSAFATVGSYASEVITDSDAEADGDPAFCTAAPTADDSSFGGGEYTVTGCTMVKYTKQLGSTDKTPGKKIVFYRCVAKLSDGTERTYSGAFHENNEQCGIDSCLNFCQGLDENFNGTPGVQDDREKKKGGGRVNWKPAPTSDRK